MKLSVPPVFQQEHDELPPAMVIDNKSDYDVIKTRAGYRCLRCDKMTTLTGITGHFEKHHPEIDFASLSVFEHDVVRIVTGFVCLTCRVPYFSRKRHNFKRHATSETGGCLLGRDPAKLDTMPAVNCFVYATGHFHSVVTSDASKLRALQVNQSPIEDWRVAFYDNAGPVANELKWDFGMNQDLIAILNADIVAALDGGTLKHFMQQGIAVTNTTMPVSFNRSIEDYVRTHARLDAAIAPGNVSHALVAFREESEYRGGFSPRDNDNVVISEMQKMARYVFGRLACVAEFEDKHDVNAVPYFFRALYTQVGIATTHCVPAVLKYIVFRMFTGTDRSQSATAISSMLATVLYIGRMCTLSFAMNQHGLDFMERQLGCCRALNGTHTVNTICKLIRRLRIHSNSTPNRPGDSIDADRTIHIDGHSFPWSKVSCLLRTMVSKMKPLFETMLSDKSKEIVTILLDPRSTMKPGNNGGFKIIGHDIIISSDDIEVIDGCFEELEKLQAFLDTAFQGLSFGSMRYAEVERLRKELIQFFHHQMWFWSQGTKRANIYRTSNKLVERRLPILATKMYMLFMFIITHLGYKVKRQYKPSWALQVLFGLESEPTMLVVRHFFVDMTNVIFGHMEASFEDQEQVAEQAGHSLRTHISHYKLPGNVTDKHERFRLAIGDQTLTHAITQLSMLDCKEALLRWYGEGAVMRAGQSGVMEVLISNESGHVTVSCGSGKTHAAPIAIEAAKFIGLNFGCTIFIVPYRLLIESLVAGMDGHQLEIVQVLTEDIMSDGTIPLLEDGLPHIIFMTIDSFAKFMELGRRHYSTWRSSGKLRRIIVDEIHLLFLEPFRQAFNVLREIRRVDPDVQLITMSGSMPPGVERKLKRWMGMENSPTVTSPSLGLEGIPIHIISSSQVVQVVEHCASRISVGGVQVFCQTKDQVKAVYYAAFAKFGHSRRIEMVSSETDAKLKPGIARGWAEGAIDILVTTTQGLVGNTNSQLRSVFIFGHIWNVANLIQAFGRLRPDQRDNCLGLVFYDKTQIPLHRSLYDRLDPDLQDEFVKKFVDGDELTNFFECTDCRSQWLSLFFGFIPQAPCGICDNCDRGGLDTLLNLCRSEVPNHRIAMDAAFPYLEDELKPSAIDQSSRSGVQLFQKHQIDRDFGFFRAVEGTCNDDNSCGASFGGDLGSAPSSTQETVAGSLMEEPIKLPSAASSSQASTNSHPSQAELTQPAVRKVASLPATKPRVNNPYAKTAVTKPPPQPVTKPGVQIFSATRPPPNARQSDVGSSNYPQNNDDVRRKAKALDFLKTLENRCAHCNNDECNGENCVPKPFCYTCLRKLVPEGCPKNCRSLYKSPKDFGWKLQVCKNCWVPGPSHKHTHCPVKKRWKRIVNNLGDPCDQRYSYDSMAAFYNALLNAKDTYDSRRKTPPNRASISSNKVVSRQHTDTKRQATQPPISQRSDKRKKQPMILSSRSSSGVGGTVDKRQVLSSPEFLAEVLSQEGLTTPMPWLPIGSQESILHNWSQTSFLNGDDQAQPLPVTPKIEKKTFRTEEDRIIKLDQVSTILQANECHILSGLSQPGLPPDTITNQACDDVICDRMIETKESARNMFHQVLETDLLTAPGPDYHLVGASSRPLFYYGIPDCIVPVTGRTATVEISKFGFPRSHPNPTAPTMIHIARTNSPQLLKSGLHLANKVCRLQEEEDIRTIPAVAYEKGSHHGGGYNHSEEEYYWPNGKRCRKQISNFVGALKTSDLGPLFMQHLEALLSTWSHDLGTLTYEEATVAKNLLSGPRYYTNHRKTIIVFLRKSGSRPSLRSTRKMFVCHNLSLASNGQSKQAGEALIVDVTAGGVAISFDPSGIYHSFSLAAVDEVDDDDMFAIILTDRPRVK